MKRIEFPTVTSERDRGLDEVFPGQRSILLMRQPQARDDPGNPCGAWTEATVLGEGAARVQIHVPRRGPRRHFPVVDGGGGAVGEANHHEAPAADVARRRMGNAESKPDRHRSIDSIATLLQNRQADIGRVALGARHRPLAPDRKAVADRCDCLGLRAHGNAIIGPGFNRCRRRRRLGRRWLRRFGRRPGEAVFPQASASRAARRTLLRSPGPATGKGLNGACFSVIAASYTMSHCAPAPGPRCLLRSPPRGRKPRCTPPTQRFPGNSGRGQVSARYR